MSDTVWRIHDYRVKKYRTLQQFADAMDVTYTKASQWDHGIDATLSYYTWSEESRVNIGKIAKALDISYDEVVACVKERWPHAWGGPSESTPLFSTPHYAVLFVAPDAPREVIEAAYRALAKKYHPDYGGTKEQMQRINAAKDALLK